MMMVAVKSGGFYKTRDGRKFGPAEWNDGFFSMNGWHYNCHGIHGYKGQAAHSMSKLDLVSEWTDTPAEVIGENVRAIPINEVPQPRSKYHRIIKGVELDIYDILVAWSVTCPARQHAIKKMFMAGERGAKGVVQDLDEAIQAVERAKELVE